MHSELCETYMMECFCEDNEQLKGVIKYLQKSFIDVSQGSKYASGLNFKNFSIQFTLDQRLKSSAQLVNTFSFPGSSSSIKREHFFL